MSSNQQRGKPNPASSDSKFRIFPFVPKMKYLSPNFKNANTSLFFFLLSKYIILHRFKVIEEL
jgi:hypothetical protein